MKAKIFTFILSFVSVLSLSAQTTYTVSSAADDGAGTLRDLVANIESGDVIKIPSDYVIVLNSEIVCAKHITIIGEGQGATIKVAEPGVSTHRLFNLGSSSSSTIFNISLQNLKLQGGNIKLNASANGGAILIVKRVNLNLKSCQITDSQAAVGGAISVADGVGVSALIEDCTFSGNSASSSGGACSFVKSQSTTDGPGEAVFTNTQFKANTSAGSAAITMNIPATFTNCLFLENVSTGTSRGSSTFYANDSAGANCRLTNCSFIGNSTGATDSFSNPDGGTYTVLQKGATTTHFLVNCTFYNNKGGRGAMYLFGGKIFMVNCTVTGNVGYNSNVYAGGIYTTTDTKGTETRGLVLVNSIVAYNYFVSKDVSQLMDTYFGKTHVVTAEKNIIASAKNNADSFTNTTPVAFFYDTDPTYDDLLFESYTTNSHGHKIPTCNSVNYTVPLDKSGIATGKGLSKDMIVDPEIEALVPTTDQRGIARSTTAPSLGSYELEDPSSVEIQTGKKAQILVMNVVADRLSLNNNEQISRLQIIDMTGRVLLSKVNPSSDVALDNIPAGYYIVRFDTSSGIVTEKLIVR